MVSSAIINLNEYLFSKSLQIRVFEKQASSNYSQISQETRAIITKNCLGTQQILTFNGSALSQTEYDREMFFLDVV